jgi:hypothetical protein
MTSLPDDQVLQLRAIKSERCAASDRNTCARSSESASPSLPSLWQVCWANIGKRFGEEVSQRHVQSQSNPLQDVNRRILLPSLHASQVGPIDAGIVSQSLLRDAFLHAKPPYISSDKNPPAHGEDDFD